LLEVRPDRQGRFLNDVSVCILDRLQAEHAPEVLQRNGLGSFLDILLRPTAEAQRALASEPRIARLLFHVVKETLL
jgi:hypothetical protein